MKGEILKLLKETEDTILRMNLMENMVSVSRNLQARNLWM